MKYGMLLYCLMIGLTSAGELYKWQDASGQWHFGDAAHVDPRAGAKSVDIAPEAQNVVKTKVIKSVQKKEKKQAQSRSAGKNQAAAVVSVREQKLKCDKWREKLHLQAFRDAERNDYDHECVSAIKW